MNRRAERTSCLANHTEMFPHDDMHFTWRENLLEPIELNIRIITVAFTMEAIVLLVSAVGGGGWVKRAPTP